MSNELLTTLVDLSEQLPRSFIPRKVFADMCGVSEITIRRAIRNGQLPPCIHVGNRSGWMASALLEHFHARQLEKLAAFTGHT
jgi:predicted DNA-binding transcriptional regulator AlpA